jgi:probable F420-dependent oxidoreductase
MVLSENWTVLDPRDLRGLVRVAQEAEAAGVDAAMFSEHVVLGPSAGAQGRMANPKEYAAPGNQDPATPWPDTLVLMSAVAAATTRLRVVGAAIIAPLRHPLLLANQLATLDLLSEGRLVVQPTVSWHEEEYAALGVPFRRRGRLLDEHLPAWRGAWRDTPTSFAGREYAYEDVYVEPKPFRPGGPRLWFGGMEISAPILRRLVEFGHGFHPFGQPSAEALRTVFDAWTAAGRALEDLEVVGGLRPRFPDATRPADLAEAAERAIPPQAAAGYTSFCFNPSHYTDDAARIPALCRDLVARAAALAG